MDKIAAGSDKPILAGIFLLNLPKNAQFINRCVPGVNIPSTLSTGWNKLQPAPGRNKDCG